MAGVFRDFRGALGARFGFGFGAVAVTAAEDDGCAIGSLTGSDMAGSTGAAGPDLAGVSTFFFAT